MVSESGEPDRPESLSVVDEFLPNHTTLLSDDSLNPALILVDGAAVLLEIMMI
jgi:hypothetical protein